MKRARRKKKAALKTLQKLKVHCSQETSPLTPLFELGQSLKCSVLPTSAPTVCRRIPQLTQGMVLPVALGNCIPDLLIKKPLLNIKKARQTSTVDLKGEDILQWPFLFPLSTFLDLPDRLCYNSWPWFSCTGSCGALQLPCGVGAGLPQEGNLSCPKSHCFEEKTEPPQRLRNIQVVFKPRHKGELRPMLEITNSSYDMKEVV